MNKRKFHHSWTLIKRVNYGYFLVLAVIFAVISVFALRQNNLTAIKLRDEVLRVDKENGDVESALRDLRTHIHGHMNSNLATNTSVYPPIQLKYRYERLVQAEKERVTKTNSNLYIDAQAHCERTLPSGNIGSSRLNCIQSYLDSHPDVTDYPVQDAAYKFDFVSPSWSPDLAGMSLVLASFFATLFGLRLGIELWLRNQFKKHL